jgi:hypothetical protein
VARHLAWTHAEWALLVDLLQRFEEGIPEQEIERAHNFLRAAALTSEDPKWRRRAVDPSFRSLGSVWAHYHLALRTREAAERWRAPVRLRDVWERADRDPQAVGLIAAEVQSGVVREGNPYWVTDEAALRLFLLDIGALLSESVELIRDMPRSRASRALVDAHNEAWIDLQARGAVLAILDELDMPEAAAALYGVGLSGVQLRWKLTGWLEALTEWRTARTAEALRRAFRWANLMLGSMGEVVAGPGLDLFKEFKEGTEAVLDEATPQGGYLLAPVFG